ncbi:MAG: site-2 protease family protein [Planctomycetaceae bacterium]
MEILNYMPLAAGAVWSVFDALQTILAVVFGLGMVIFFHELGHFAVAKWCNVHVERFSIGIGPIIWSHQRGETEYALSVLPLGGYVKMLGQDDMDPNQMTSSEIAENPRSYSSKTVLQRMAIISAGVIMNVATGFLFFAIGYWNGVPESAPVVGSVKAGFPAWEAGIRAGDRVTAVNEEPIRSFFDLQEAILLSSGDLRIDVERNGKALPAPIVLTPVQAPLGPTIGVNPAVTTEIGAIADPGLIADAGMAVEKASEGFLPGDKIVSLQPQSESAEAGADEVSKQPVHLIADLRQVLATYADREMVYGVERKGADGAATTVSIKVPPQPVRKLGFWMAMGPIRAIQKDSPAAMAGLKVGDTIRSVDGLKPGEDIDPLSLPVYFGKKAGQAVTVMYSRATSGGSVEGQCELTPNANLPGWMESPDSSTSPLTIPSIGLGYQVQNYVAKVLPGSEVEKLGGLSQLTKITKVELLHREPGTGKPDAWGNEETPVELPLTAKEDVSEEEAEANWAWAFDQLQRAPGRKIVLHFEDGKTTGTRTLQELELEDDWFLWVRGFNPEIWESEQVVLGAKSPLEALSLGLARTQKVAFSIYRSLKKMVRREVAAKSLSGPVGIAKIAYKVAEQGFLELLVFLGILSINLAILNFLPIPILDGGHMVFLLWEGITRRKPSITVINWAHAAGMVFLLSLLIFVMWIDLFVSGS